MQTARRGACSQPDQSGFSLVEIVIAMFVLALMALAVLPLAITTTRASVTNRSVIAATAFANATLEAIRADFPDDASSSCANVRARQAVGVPGPAGTGLEARIQVSPTTCPGALPSTVTVTVSVTRPPGAGALVTLATEVVVTTA